MKALVQLYLYMNSASSRPLSGRGHDPMHRKFGRGQGKRKRRRAQRIRFNSTLYLLSNSTETLRNSYCSKHKHNKPTFNCNIKFVKSWPLALSIHIAYGRENLFKALCHGNLCSLMNRRPFLYVCVTLKQLLLREMSGCSDGPGFRPIRKSSKLCFNLLL